MHASLQAKYILNTIQNEKASVDTSCRAIARVLASRAHITAPLYYREHVVVHASL